MKPTAFLDRDGTVCEERNYLSDPADLHLMPGAARAIRALNDADVQVVLLTNQSGIARGYFNEEQLHIINARLEEMLRDECGATIDAIYYCPHHAAKGIPPYNIDCTCRKPKTGMALRAAQQLAIDMTKSCVIGDKLSDTRMGVTLGLPHCILVETGYGKQEAVTGNCPTDYTHTAPSLNEAVALYLS